MAFRLPLHRLPEQNLRAMPRFAQSSRNISLATRRNLTSAALRNCVRNTNRPASGVPRVLGANVSRSSFAPLGGYQIRTYADTIVKVPQMAESITEGTLKQFSKQVGDYVERDEEIATIETDKIDVSVNAPEAGTIKELLVSEEDTVTVGQELAKLELGGAPETKTEEATEKPKEPAPTEKPKAPEPDQPKTAKASSASEKPAVSESGPSKQPQPAVSKPEARDDAKPSPGSREERRVKMNRMRLRIAERLKQSQNTAASLTTFNEVDMSSLMDFRKLYKDDVLKKTGVKLGFMSAFSRACVLAMKDIPAVNASIEGPNGGDTIVYRDYVDISVAVATEKGLVTPVVRNAETMDLVGIEKAIADLGKKARDNKLTIEDMAGGSFTISNGGVFGSLMGTPIINLPQTAVLGLHAIKEKPVAVNGKIEIRPMMYLALTYDHRLLDGREAVTFLVKVKEYIEDPRRMLLG
ncbi:dihydrolipoyllysine-residue succinyltransferase component of 2-oxoglutarate dehydrogenase complex [Aspergillus bombycis]|uniref:dihydrolipoyllysine-residue succinyltransferase n=1 Tax=Aspergillus bombycis TaxID=109264 RepID=A0A1F7ZJY4_9EURO|nr:dihydrolipoyllysine-residue succinyltransferase component of 2-oxoglutarate dehydrogenase complex [Aspergillus bombycis]OGM39760.1 dihydrolipoyllysine-residue succinyltransferase component of 2-oxoglutarate dehydrogenase complex [Aspergillus bombycis]